MIQEIKKKKINKEIFWALLTKGVTLVLFIALNALIARQLGPDNFGVWSLFLSVMTLMSMLSYLGINNSTKKFVAQYNETDNLKNVLISSIKLRFIFSFLFSILLLIIYKPLTILLNNPELEVLFLYGIPLIFLYGFVDYFKSVFIGLYRIKYNFFINLSEFVLKLFFVALFFLFSNSVINVINSFTLALFVTTFLGFYFLYFNFYKNLNTSKKVFTKKILSYSLPLVIVSFGSIVLGEIDIIMLGTLSSTVETGNYAIAKALILKMPNITIAIVMGTMPIFAKLNEKNKENLKQKFNKILKYNLFIYIPLIFIAFLISPIIIPFVFGGEYQGAVMPFRVLLIHLFFNINSIIFGHFLDYVGKAKVRSFNILITIITNISLNLILIPMYGAVGAAIGTSISFAPYVILNWIEIKKTFGIKI